MSQKKEDGTHVHKSSKQWQVTAEGIKIEMFEKGGEKMGKEIRLRTYAKTTKLFLKNIKTTAHSKNIFEVICLFFVIKSKQK